MNRGRLPPGRLFFLLPTKERTKENCRCFDAADPRPRGCTPLGTPKRKSQRARATRTQYYCSRLTPAPSAPFRNSGVPPNPRRGEREAPLSKGAGRVSGLGDSDGLCVAAHSRATSAREKEPGCRPPSPLSSATRLRQSVGAGHARPATLPLPSRILCITAQPPIKITCLRPLAGRLFFCFKFFSVPFLLRKGINPRLVKITSGQSPQPRRPAPAGPAGSARPSGR